MSFFDFSAIIIPNIIGKHEGSGDFKTKGLSIYVS